jgi:hypothetical protein
MLLLVTLLLKPCVGAEEGSWRLPLLNGTYLQGHHSMHTTLSHTTAAEILALSSRSSNTNMLAA